MNKKIITRVIDLPTWFNLKNYSPASSFNTSEWQCELKNRLELRIRWQPEKDDFSSMDRNDLWGIIKQYGLIHNKPIDKYEEKLFYSFGKLHAEKDDEQDDIEIPLMSLTTVHNLMAYSFYWYHPEKDELDKLMNINFCDSDDEIDPKVKKAAFNWLWQRCEHPLAWFLGEVGKHTYLQVNLDASDEQLKKDFEQWLSHERQLRKTNVPKKNFTATDFASWHESGVLPYLDLMFWSNMEDVRINQHVIAQAIFPDAYVIGSDIDPLGKLKTTKKKAEYLLSAAAFNALGLQVCD